MADTINHTSKLTSEGLFFKYFGRGRRAQDEKTGSDLSEAPQPDKANVERDVVSAQSFGCRGKPHSTAGTSTIIVSALEAHHGRVL